MEIKQSDKILRLNLDKDNQAVLSCPVCNFTKKIDASKYRDASKALTVKCKCGEVFKCTFDFRKFFRKKVSLAGSYVILKNQKKGDMLVLNISMGGLGMRNMTPHKLEKDDALEISFALDDSKRTRINRIAKVILVNNQFVGMEFIDKSRFDKELGFYLKP
jgi:hypothetical protein